MTIVVLAPHVEHQLKEINETLRKIHSVMADDFSDEDTSVQKTVCAISAAKKAVEQAKTRIPIPESEQQPTQGE